MREPNGRRLAALYLARAAADQAQRAHTASTAPATEQTAPTTKEP